MAKIDVPARVVDYGDRVPTPALPSNPTSQARQYSRSSFGGRGRSEISRRRTRHDPTHGDDTASSNSQRGVW